MSVMRLIPRRTMMRCTVTGASYPDVVNVTRESDGLVIDLEAASTAADVS